MKGEDTDRGVCRQHAESGLTQWSSRYELKKAKLRRNTLSKRKRGKRKPRPDRPNSAERRRLKALGLRWQDVVKNT